jgi:hypothetical protein
LTSGCQKKYEKCLVGFTAITKEAWNTSQNTEDKRENIQALSLAKDCYSMKLDLLTNATLVDDAIRFVSKSKEKSKSSANDSEHNKEDQLEQEQEKETGEMKTNQVF